MILMMDKYKSRAIPQNPHWHARHISPSPPFILPTKKLHECYPLLHWTFTRQHGSAKESSITASMGAMHCLCQTQEQRPAVLCLNAGKKHFPYSSISIWSSRNFMNKTDHKIVEGCKEWEMSKAMIRHYDNSDSMVCTPPRVPSSHHCNHQVSLTKHGSTACEVTSVDPSKLKTWNLEFSWIYDHSIHEAVQSYVKKNRMDLSQRLQVLVPVSIEWRCTQLWSCFDWYTWKYQKHRNFVRMGQMILNHRETLPQSNSLTFFQVGQTSATSPLYPAFGWYPDHEPPTHQPHPASPRMPPKYLVVTSPAWLKHQGFHKQCPGR